MRKLIVAEHISLDGVVQAPGAPNEDPGGGFAFGGWTVPFADERIGRAVQDMLSQPFELLLGRRTYDIFAPYWSRLGRESPGNPIAEPFNRVPKHVATRRAGGLDWQNSRALEGELADAVRALKRQDGADLLTWGDAPGASPPEGTAPFIKTRMAPPLPAKMPA